ncbi:MAG: tetratricopeptide repeat protein [Candidatus Gastranaerophilales bacterium]|nr:tetratricopeptide repeat protein [Candidatus Gastranaerophilales bacterium]
MIAAIALFDNGDNAAALASFLEIVEVAKNSLPFTCIGNCYKKMGDLQKAKVYYEKAIELPVTTPHPYIALGNMYYQEGDVHKAILLWTAANTLVVDDSSLLLNLASAYSKLELRIQAVQYYQKIVTYSSKKTFSIYEQIHSMVSKLRNIASKNNQIGTRYYNAKHYDKALECYLTSIKNYPLQPKIQYLVGNMLFMMNDYQGSIDCWSDAYIVSDFNPVYIGMMPLAYEKLNKPSYAYAYYYTLMSSQSQTALSPEIIKQKLLNLGVIVYTKDSNYSDYHFNLAKKYEQESNFLMANIEYQHSLVLTKSNKQKIESCLKKMHDFLHPELRVISSMQLMVTKLMKDSNYDAAINLCDKILGYAQDNTQIIAVIRRKKDECLRLSKISKK